MEKIDRAKDFLAKASTVLEWSETEFEKMIEAGKLAKIEEVRRTFFNILAYMSTAFDAIRDTSKLAGLNDWKSNFETTTENDPLLSYFIAARNVDAHDRLLKWDPALVQVDLRVIDPNKLRSVVKSYSPTPNYIELAWCYAYHSNTPEQATKKFFEGVLPDSERLEKAGLALAGTMHGLQFIPIKTNTGKRRNFPIPKIHLDAPIEESIHVATKAVIDHYKEKRNELAKMMGES